MITLADTVAEATAAAVARGVTARQASFIATLAEERGLDVIVTLSGVTDKRDASRAIDGLLATPRLPRPRAAGNSLPDVPAGYYAVPSRTGSNDLDFWVVWRGSQGGVSVKRVIGGRPEMPVRGTERRTALDAIVAEGIDAARTAYATEIGRCGRCNRTLTVEASRHRGLGPECANKV